MIFGAVLERNPLRSHGLAVVPIASAFKGLVGLFRSLGAGIES